MTATQFEASFSKFESALDKVNDPELASEILVLATTICANLHVSHVEMELRQKKLAKLELALANSEHAVFKCWTYGVFTFIVGLQLFAVIMSACAKAARV